MTPRLSSACSNQLSYSRLDDEKGRGAHRNPCSSRGRPEGLLRPSYSIERS